MTTRAESNLGLKAPLHSIRQAGFTALEGKEPENNYGIPNFNPKKDAIIIVRNIVRPPIAQLYNTLHISYTHHRGFSLEDFLKGNNNKFDKLFIYQGHFKSEASRARDSEDPFEAGTDTLMLNRPSESGIRLKEYCRRYPAFAEIKVWERKDPEEIDSTFKECLPRDFSNDSFKATPKFKATIEYLREEYRRLNALGQEGHKKTQAFEQLLQAIKDDYLQTTRSQASGVANNPPESFITSAIENVLNDKSNLLNQHRTGLFLRAILAFLTAGISLFFKPASHEHLEKIKDNLTANRFKIK